MLTAERAHREPAGLERLAGRGRHDLLVQLGQRRRDRRGGPDPQPRIATGSFEHTVEIDVVRVLVGDQHRRDPVERGLDLGEHPRVDDESPLTVVEPDAGVGELRQLGHSSRMCIAASSALAA